MCNVLPVKSNTAEGTYKTLWSYMKSVSHLQKNTFLQSFYRDFVVLYEAGICQHFHQLRNWNSEKLNRLTVLTQGTNTVAPRNGFFKQKILVLFLYPSIMKWCGSIDIFTAIVIQWTATAHSRLTKGPIKLSRNSKSISVCLAVANT